MKSTDNGNGNGHTYSNGVYQRLDNIDAHVKDIKQQLVDAVKELTEAKKNQAESVNKLTSAVESLTSRIESVRDAVPIKVVGWMFFILTLTVGGLKAIDYYLKTNP